MTRGSLEEGFILSHCPRAKFTMAEVLWPVTVRAQSGSKEKDSQGSAGVLSPILFSLGSPPWDGDTTSRVGPSGLLQPSGNVS